MMAVNKFDQSATFGGSSYNQKWLIETLTEKDQSFRSRLEETRITKISVEDVGSGKGFLSSVCRITIEFADEKEPFLVVIKIPSITPMASLTAGKTGDGTEDNSSYIGELHNRECDFYERIANFDILPVPKIYAIERRGKDGREGVILMEYLLGKGTLINFFDSLSSEQIRSLTKFIAKLTAYSISLSTESVEQYKLSKNLIDVLVKMNVEMGPKAAEVYPNDLKEVYRRIEHIFLKPHYVEYALTSINKQLGIKPVLSHGDLWINNMFWKKGKNGECSSDIYAVIDWQTLHAGTIGYDLSFVLAGCTDNEIRKDAEKWIFEFLYKCIQEELQGLGMAIPFSLEQIEASYRRTFLVPATQVFSFAPILLSEAVAAETKSRLLSRVKGLMEDAISILENDLPEFLDPDFVPNFFTT